MRVPFQDVGVPFNGKGVPFQSMGMPFQSVRFPFQGAGVPRHHLGVPFQDVGVPFNGKGVHFKGMGVPCQDVRVPIQGIGAISYSDPPKPVMEWHGVRRVGDCCRSVLSGYGCVLSVCGSTLLGKVKKRCFQWKSRDQI